MQNLNDGSSQVEKSSRGGRLAQSLALKRNEGETLTNQVNVVNTTNVVQVDYIDAEYQNEDDQGFAKRKRGYNGSKATGKKHGDGDNNGGNWDGNGDGNGNSGGKGSGIKGGNGGDGKGGPDGVGDGLKPGSHLTDEQIRKIMEDDPDAGKFLDGMLPDQE